MKRSPKMIAEMLWNAVRDAKPAERSAIYHEFLRILNHRGEMKLLPKILFQLEKLEERETKRVSVIVRSAHPVSHDALQPILATLFPEQTPVVHQETVPALIGGMQISTRDRRWDFSLHGALRDLRKHLIR
ncbi:MAG: F0F1 ATP synthase subunit delta [Candidatus Kerfeldbacteria bacterium]|nr:F0F1 ATP synthase subunit delta [Candidatus Kerfeldbacteria bacterium]